MESATDPDVVDAVRVQNVSVSALFPVVLSSSQSRQVSPSDAHLILVEFAVPSP